MERFLEASIEKFAPAFRIRERLLKAGRGQQEAELAIRDQNEQLFRPGVRGESLGRGAPMFRRSQRGDEREQTPARG